MHYEGGHRQGEDYPGVREWIQPWAEAPDCEKTKERQVGRKGEDVVRTQWTQCTEETPAPVELYSVADGGHVWPGEVVYSGGGYVTEDFSATDTIWDFFLNHPGATKGPAQK